MSASRGDSRAEPGPSCSPVRNKSFARLSLREEQEGLREVRRHCQARVGPEQRGLAGCHSAACRHRWERRAQKSEIRNVRAGLRARAATACLGAGLLSAFVMFWESSPENGLNKEPFLYQRALPLSRSPSFIKEAEKMATSSALYWNSK